MEKYGVNTLRKMFLDFMESKGCLVMKSFSLVPHNDNSVLLINAGMTPLKPYFTGAEVPPRTRVATCQKCIRTGDIDNVGHTARHGTFFEMLGNFSFGDYFKTEAIHWSWEFLTETVGLDPDRLYPSVYLDDDEAFEIWNKEIGIPKEKIYRFGKEDNFWEHGAGPCGPCSEIYYDRGEKYGCGKPDCAPGCDCDRFMEVWNNVFTQFNNDGHGNYTTLAKKNIDTGMGLERLAVAVQDVDSMFDIDTIFALREKICEIAGVRYKEKEETDVSVRIITDHIRSASFMISDGITPSNEGRGYVLRRLIRRAARHGRKLGIEGSFLADLAKTVADTSKEGYPELEEKYRFIHDVLAAEEAAFGKTIDQGLKILEDRIAELSESGEKVLSGPKAFELYDTYGFPLDLTKDILTEKGYSVDEEGFNKSMQEQKKRAKDARKTSNYIGSAATVYDEIGNEITTEFKGYETTECDSEIVVLTTKVDEDHYGELTLSLADGDEGTVITRETPFYATMGGQIGDTGVIRTDDGVFRVTSTEPLRGGKTAHNGYVEEGTIVKGSKALLQVDRELRQATADNHSATHLLQAALKEVLGEHVQQKGSYVDPEHLRFDFVHFKPMSAEEIRRTEEIVNRKICEGLPVETQVLSIDEARKTGATALFGEKYGEKVRVVSMGDFSKEFCGGTHVKNTSDIRAFKITSEAGIAAGVRRIEALSSEGVFRHYKAEEDELLRSAKLLKTGAGDVSAKISHLMDELKEARSEIEAWKAKAAHSSMGDAASEATEIDGVKVLVKKLDNVAMNDMRNLGDELKAKLGDAVIVLASAVDGKVSLMACASDGAIKKGAHAGNIVKAAAPKVGGGGGGRPNMAQAGGKNPAGIEEALKEAVESVKKQISAQKSC
ncbi:MAG: alanine--tRNA ligase [Lachnospiraceae bacterium]|nr:alanine--tRNA ligase [Lachnospiraceae bacterium]